MDCGGMQVSSSVPGPAWVAEPLSFRSCTDGMCASMCDTNILAGVPVPVTVLLCRWGEQPGELATGMAWPSPHPSSERGLKSGVRVTTSLCVPKVPVGRAVFITGPPIRGVCPSRRPALPPLLCFLLYLSYILHACYQQHWPAHLSALRECCGLNHFARPVAKR